MSFSVGDSVKYIGKCDICTDGTWVIVGRSYVIETIDNITIKLKGKAGLFVSHEFEPSDNIPLDTYTESKMDNVYIALMDLKCAINNLRMSIKKRYKSY